MFQNKYYLKFLIVDYLKSTKIKEPNHIIKKFLKIQFKKILYVSKIKLINEEIFILKNINLQIFKIFKNF